LGGIKGAIEYACWKNHRALRSDGYPPRARRKWRSIRRAGFEPQPWNSSDTLSPTGGAPPPRFTAGGHLGHLFISTRFVCRALPRLPTFGRLRGERVKETKERTPEGREPSLRPSAPNPQPTAPRGDGETRESRWGRKIRGRGSKPVITVRTSRPPWWSTFRGGSGGNGRREEKPATRLEKNGDNSSLRLEPRALREFLSPYSRAHPLSLPSFDSSPGGLFIVLKVFLLSSLMITIINLPSETISNTDMTLTRHEDRLHRTHYSR